MIVVVGRSSVFHGIVRTKKMLDLFFFFTLILKYIFGRRIPGNSVLVTPVIVKTRTLASANHYEAMIV